MRFRFWDGAAVRHGAGLGGPDLRTTTYAAALAAALALAVAAPGAHAYGGLGCGLNAASEHQAWGGTIAGGPFTDTGPVAIQCSVTVNGVLVYVGPVGSGYGVAATGDSIYLKAGPADRVTVCTEITVPAGTQLYCHPVVPVVVGAVTYWNLPQPVI